MPHYTEASEHGSFNMAWDSNFNPIKLTLSVGVGCLDLEEGTGPGLPETTPCKHPQLADFTKHIRMIGLVS